MNNFTSSPQTSGLILARMLCLSLGAAALMVTSLSAQEIDPYSIYKNKASEAKVETTESNLPEAESKTPQPDEYTEGALEESPKKTINDIEDLTPEAEPEPKPETETEIGTETEAQTDSQSDVALPPEQDPLSKLPALKQARMDIAPFYLTAKEYLALRGNETSAQTRLTYSVVTKPLSEIEDDTDSEKEANAFTPQKVTLTLGPDFAMITRGPEKRLYDFRFNRLLRISTPSEEGAAPHFTNSSLYPLVHRNTRLIANATDKGKRDSVSNGANEKLDAFWLESAMSWTMNDRAGTLHTEMQNDETLITYKGQMATQYSLDDAPFIDPDQSDAFLAFAHHNLPLHPSILRQFYGASAPLKSHHLAAITPQNPQGSVQIWTLERRTNNPDIFPLPQAALSTTQGPIPFIINEAARGRALGGRPSAQALIGDIESAAQDEDWTSAWLTAQRYMAYTKPCADADKRKTCKTLAAIEARTDLPEPLKALMSGFKDAKTAKTRVRALQTLKPWSGKEDTPAIVIRVIGLTRAKISTSTAKAAGIETLDAKPLIDRALALDPYDPRTYLGLAQFYAANGEYDAAWDVYDALRVSITNDASAPFRVDNAEANLQDRAPGYFMLSAIAQGH
jgi:hypothetical protein